MDDLEDLELHRTRGPIVIHLWQRRKVIQVKFSTLRFLKIVVAKPAARQRLKTSCSPLALLDHRAGRVGGDAADPLFQTHAVEK